VVEPTPVVEATPEPAPVPPPAIASQADIEAQLREQGRQPDDDRTATGFELNVIVGYQFWLSDGPWNSSGAPTLRVSLGLRLPWPLSFGISLLDVSADFGSPQTDALVTLSPGAYLRAHTQKYRKLNSFDFWGGVGFVPFAIALASFDDSATTEERLAGIDPNKVDSALVDRLGIGRFVTRQSMNIPLEIGATWYVTRGVGIALNAAFTFWLPQQLCYHNAGDHYCIDEGLKTEHSFFIGAGASFLP
jgi:hypothetical protein